MFAQGSSRKFNGVKWIDYVMFKELLILSGLVPCREIPDWKIDKIYAKFTSYERMTN
jgi:hypothetical protein